MIINLAWLGDRIRAHVGDGSAWGLSVTYSDEGELALETAGGIVQALPLLGEEPFVVVNGDVYTDYPIANAGLADEDLAHLVLVDNPPQHPAGDFALEAGRVHAVEPDAGLREALAAKGVQAVDAPLAPLLRETAGRGRVSGEHYRGQWWDIGTPERLAALDRVLTGAD